MKLLSENPRFEIRQLVVECNGKLTEDFIREMSQLHEGQNLCYAIQEVEDNLLNVSRIESVYIERDLPKYAYSSSQGASSGYTIDGKLFFTLSF